MMKWTMGLVAVSLITGVTGCQSTQPTGTTKPATSAVSAASDKAVGAAESAKKGTAAAAPQAAKEVALLPGFAALDSSAMKGAMYNAETKVLSIQFTSGDVYDYPKVDQAVFDGLMKSKSKGKYYVDEIKDKFEGVKR